MKYVLQHNSLNVEHVEQIRQTVINRNLPHIFVGVIPFTREITSDEPLVGTDYIPYGSTRLTIEAYQLGWKGLYFNPETFRTEVGNANRNDMLNQDANILTVKQAIDFLRQHDKNKDFFIRPVEDLKAFSGQVIQVGECAEWLIDAMECASSGNYQLSADMYVAIAEPKNIQAEWRWFVIDGKVVSGSMYRCRGQMKKVRELDQAVIDEAQGLADVWLPLPCCVMDTALVDGYVKVIEFNTINSSGFYDNDVEKVFVELYNYTCNHK